MPEWKRLCKQAARVKRTEALLRKVMQYWVTDPFYGWSLEYPQLLIWKKPQHLTVNTGTGGVGLPGMHALSFPDPPWVWGQTASYTFCSDSAIWATEKHPFRKCQCYNSEWHSSEQRSKPGGNQHCAFGSVHTNPAHIQHLRVLLPQSKRGRRPGIISFYKKGS